MKLVIRSISTWDAPNLRVWFPEDDLCFADTVTLSIGPHPGNKTDSFYLRVATPAGLAKMQPVDGIVAVGPVLILARYDFDILWNWVSHVVKKSETATWLECVENLKRFFVWEYENYDEGQNKYIKRDSTKIL